MRLLFIGDVVGKGGRKAVAHLTPVLRAEYGCDFCIANGENMAGGGGLSRRCLDELLTAGVDVVTTGDHIWDQKDFVTQIVECPTVLRPANLPPAQPGRGFAVFPTVCGVPVLVMSLLGRVFMGHHADCPFRAADAILAECASQARIVFVDFHTEATSEKIALGRHLDGRVSAVIGTHTHVPTADEQILAGGTAFQCDAGMVGARESILGRAVEPVLRRFVTGMPGHFTVVETGIRLQGTIVDIDPATGRATGIQRLVRDWDGP
jgi:metallophosphoesterase (TIGR00282 family)